MSLCTWGLPSQTTCPSTVNSISELERLPGHSLCELVFTATTDAAQWVQIYGPLRPTDANDSLT